MPVEEDQWRSKKVSNDSGDFHERVPMHEKNPRFASEPADCIRI